MEYRSTGLMELDTLLGGGLLSKGICEIRCDESFWVDCIVSSLLSEPGDYFILDPSEQISIDILNNCPTDIIKINNEEIVSAIKDKFIPDLAIFTFPLSDKTLDNCIDFSHNIKIKGGMSLFIKPLTPNVLSESHKSIKLYSQQRIEIRNQHKYKHKLEAYIQIIKNVNGVSRNKSKVEMRINN